MSFAVMTTVLLNLVVCIGGKLTSSQASTPSSLQSPTSQKAEQEVSLAWFTSSKLRGTDIISSESAKLFVNNVYQTLDDKIFAPTFKKELREQNLKALIAEVDTNSSWSRAKLTQLINNQLSKLSISHVRVFDPVEGEQLFRLFTQQSPSTAKTDPTVSTQIRGFIGIVQVKSFVTPQITRRAVEQAKAQLSQTKAILIDLRGNGGGVQSAISYLIEDIIGPDKVIATERTRNGIAMKQPYIFRGYFDDSVKNIGLAEMKLSQQKKYIQYRTRFEANKDPRPYFVLVDNQCGSACEVFAAAAQEHRAAKILGVRTSGSVLGGGVFKLRWPGFVILAPIAQTISPNGNTIEGKGIEPDIEISECKNSGEQCFEKAVEIVVANEYNPKSNFSEVEFFKGTWECSIQSSPNNKFRWSLTQGLNNAWLVGFVQVGNNKVSNDFWRLVQGRIERFAFTGDGTFVSVTSNGWESQRLKFAGSANQKTGEFQVRQTITTKGNREFRALWERLGNERKWSPFSDERCIKLN
ncbi:S41 family peptidase [Fischerella sp. PCC 9605]|uniref:S41 family peptidase n=1 Tax=Fischerella sp. PCC 9605 TaxID=1173024 RepID=UPI0018CBF628